MQARVQTILHSNDTTNFFLHEHDSKGGVVRWFGNNIFEDFYVDFWYTSNASPISKFRNTYTIVPLHGYAITGAALACALHRVSTGRVAGSGNILSFSGMVYANYSEGYHQSMVNALNNAGMSEKFKNRLLWLNQQGLKRMDQLSGRSSSPSKIHTVYIPPADEVANYEALSPSPFSSTPYPSNNPPSMHSTSPSTRLPYMQQASPSTEPSSYMYNAQAGPSTEPLSYMHNAQAGPSTEPSSYMYNTQAGPSTEPFVEQAPTDPYSYYYTF
ncbi:hypothetical protein HYDPIDRAFT_191041 [Hydnomerulius pinastri MD-312]|uniref:DUF6532 domain-containing protein n=1 Tax=Hydnomerulius pinastri MD-312 TaxID=994086 RepID=A0A0C2PG60_9AGAM|nr:hypothetical protein HYDPIDRAFT_191041 [Hydnomerulius pinastri MD-312]